MRLSIDINLDYDSLSYNDGKELDRMAIASLIRRIANRIETNEDNCKEFAVFDINGNKCGMTKILEN